MKNAPRNLSPWEKHLWNNNKRAGLSYEQLVELVEKHRKQAVELEANGFQVECVDIH
jgi:predicted negative regulator of RcsB-dependent stress response